MRILLVSHRFPPVHRAGVESYTLQLARELALRHEVHIACTEKVPSLQTGAVQERRHEGLLVHEAVQNLDHDRRAGTWRDPRMEQAFAAILARVDPAVVHFQHWMYWSTGIVELAARSGARSLLTLHDFWPQCGRMGQRIDAGGHLCPGPAEERCEPCLRATSFGQSPRARRWIRRAGWVRRVSGLRLDGPLRGLERWRARLAGPRSQLPSDAEDVEFGDRERSFRAALDGLDQLLTPSRHLAQEYERWGIPPDRIEVLPQALDPMPSGPSLTAPGADQPLRLLFLGTIAPHKGLHVLLDAISAADRKLHLLVHGPDGGDRDYCRRIATRIRELDSVDRGPLLDRRGVARAIREAHFVCVPSLWFECCPLVIQEAFLCGRPCLVSDLGGMAELVQEGMGGRRVAMGSVGAWTRTLQELADGPEAWAELCRSIPPVPPFSEHVAELERRYTGSNPGDGC